MYLMKRLAPGLTARLNAPSRHAWSGQSGLSPGAARRGA